MNLSHFNIGKHLFFIGSALGSQSKKFGKEMKEGKSIWSMNKKEKME